MKGASPGLWVVGWVLVLWGNGRVFLLLCCCCCCADLGIGQERPQLEKGIDPAAVEPQGRPLLHPVVLFDVVLWRSSLLQARGIAWGGLDGCRLLAGVGYLLTFEFALLPPERGCEW